MIRRPTYDDYDEYIIDYETSNTSFIAMASLLKRRGIKNYNFFLKLYDEDLQDVDPHDPNLSSKMKMKIIMECRRNFWYFIREVMIIPGTGRYILNRGNLALSWCCLNNIPSYEVMPRQHGKTWGVIAYALWVFNFAADYSNFLFMNKQLRDSQLNLKRLKDARAALPDYLRNDKTITSKGELRDNAGNVNTLTNALHNEINVKASARNPIAADELGRGMSVSWVWIDEIAFLQFNRIIYAAMAPAWSKAAEIAKSKGKPIGKILTTTPSDLSLDMGKFAHELKEDAARFNESLYNMDSEEINTWLDKNSKNGYIYIEYTYQQLGHVNPGPEEWFKDQCKQLLYDWSKIRREILLQWSNASSNSPFNQDDLRDLRAMMQTESDQDSIVINKYYKLNVYKKLKPENKYIISVDPAKGRGEKADRTVVCVTDAKTDECCAIFKSPNIQYKETFRFLHTLYYQYIPNSVIVVENNIDTLVEYIKNSTMKHALYYEPTKTVKKDQMKKGVIKPQSSSSIVYGITTTSDNRPKFFDILFEMVHSEPDKICARELVEEIETLEYKSETRIEATSQAHDDVVMAYLMGQYVKRFGHNRAKFGLFYSDGIEVPTANTNKSVFIKDLNARTKSETSDNLFWKEILDALEDDTDDERERSVRKSFVDNRNDELDFVSNVFSGKKDMAGTHIANRGAFYDLNVRRDYNGHNEFGDYRPIEDDVDVGSWF